MKILKLFRNSHNHYYVVFDEVPEMTYEKIGSDYVGSVIDDNENIIFSSYLKHDSWGKAFAGRELSLKMKDNTYKTIKDYWYDYGSYKEHGEFIDIGASTLERLQECYVYCGYNINRDTFQMMLDDYYSREKEYEYYEIEKWCKLQYKWYDVIIDGKKYPYMVNKKGDFVHKYSKEPIYPRTNKCIWRFQKDTGKSFDLCLFELKYNNGDRLIKIQRKMMDVLKESLPFSEEDIKHNCKIQ